VSPKGGTPLGAAIINGKLDVVELLIERGASCLYKDENGMGAMELATKFKKEAVIRYLQSIPGC